MAPDDLIALGKAIARYRREARGWSQRRLAREARCSPQSIRGLELGSRSTRSRTIERVLEVLGTTREGLIAPALDPLWAELNPEDLEIARLHQLAPSKKRSLVRAILDGRGAIEAGSEVSARWARIIAKSEKLPPEAHAAILAVIEQYVSNVGGVPETILPEVKPFRKSSM